MMFALDQGGVSYRGTSQARAGHGVVGIGGISVEDDVEFTVAACSSLLLLAAP